MAPRTESPTPSAATMKVGRRGMRKSQTRNVSTSQGWRVLRTGTGWTDLPEAAGHIAELRRIYTNKNPDQCVVLKDSIDYKLLVKSSKNGDVFMLIEYAKMFDHLEVKRISLVKPTDA